MLQSKSIASISVKNIEASNTLLFNYSGGNLLNQSLTKLGGSFPKNDLKKRSAFSPDIVTDDEADNRRGDKDAKSRTLLNQKTASTLYNINPKFENIADKKALLFKEEQIKSLEANVLSKEREIEMLEDIIKDNSIEKNQLVKTRNALMKELEEKNDELSLLKEEKEILFKKLNNLKQKNMNLLTDLETSENIKLDLEEALNEKRQRMKHLDEERIKLLKENEELNNLIENYKIENLNNKNDNLKKAEKISELQGRVIDYEQEIFDIKSKSNTELIPLKDAKNNFETLKASYYELKNQYELLNIKFQTVNDENFSLKRDLYLQENENKNKNDVVDRYRNEVLELKKKQMNEEFIERNESKNRKPFSSKYRNEVSDYEDDIENERERIRERNRDKNSHKERIMERDRTSNKRTFSKMKEASPPKSNKAGKVSKETKRNLHSNFTNNYESQKKKKEKPNYDWEDDEYDNRFDYTSKKNSDNRRNFSKLSRERSGSSKRKDFNESIKSRKSNKSVSFEKDRSYFDSKTDFYKKEEQFNNSNTFSAHKGKRTFKNNYMNKTSNDSLEKNFKAASFKPETKTSYDPMSNVKPIDKKNEVMKRKVEEVQLVLDGLNLQKETLSSKLSKLPEFPRKRNQIEEKAETENDLNKVQFEIALTKKELREAHSAYKEF